MALIAIDSTNTVTIKTKTGV